MLSKPSNLTSRSLAESTSKRSLFGSSEVPEASHLIASHRIRHGRLFRCSLPAAGGHTRRRRRDGSHDQAGIGYAAGLHEPRRSQRIHSGRPSGRRSRVFRAAHTSEEGRHPAGVPQQDGRLRTDRKFPSPFPFPPNPTTKKPPLQSPTANAHRSPTQSRTTT